MRNSSDVFAKFVRRSVSGVVMAAVVAAAIFAGPFVLSLFLLVCQAVIFFELTRIKADREYEAKHCRRLTRVRLNMFVAAAFAVQGQFMLQHAFPETVAARVAPLCSALLLVSAQVAAVMVLDPPHLGYQVPQLIIAAVAAAVSAGQLGLAVRTIYAGGMLWFLVPALFVICNDCFAYAWGVTLGRHSLLKVSPSKSWEGFIGALFTTMAAALFVTPALVAFSPHAVCPVPSGSLGLYPLAAAACEVPAWLQPMEAFGHDTTPFTLAMVAMGFFTSTVAPFGGFLASGIKRATGIKDYGNSIPGHGGFTDRLDCQLPTAVVGYALFSCIQAFL
jgi:phosphatidate cytidylyltransferase